jgi:hypothetical protein
MPVKRRLPKARAFVPSPELLKLYRRARFLESNDGVYSWDGHLTDEYRELRDRIDTLCGFAPWNQNILDVREGDTSDYAERGLEIRPVIDSAAGLLVRRVPDPDYLKTKTTHQRALWGREGASSRAFGRFLDTAFAKQEHASRGGKINTFAERTFFLSGVSSPRPLRRASPLWLAVVVGACIATAGAEHGPSRLGHRWNRQAIYLSALTKGRSS